MQTKIRARLAKGLSADDEFPLYREQWRRIVNGVPSCGFVLATWRSWLRRKRPVKRRRPSSAWDRVGKRTRTASCA